jgi:hypothetical protein
VQNKDEEKEKTRDMIYLTEAIWYLR